MLSAICSCMQRARTPAREGSQGQDQALLLTLEATSALSTVLLRAGRAPSSRAVSDLALRCGDSDGWLLLTIDRLTSVDHQVSPEPSCSRSHASLAMHPWLRSVARHADHRVAVTNDMLTTASPLQTTC